MKTKTKKKFSRKTLSKKTKVSKKKKKTKSSDVSAGSRLRASDAPGLKVMDAWRFALDYNLAAKKSDRLSDADILYWMNAQFPDRTKDFTKVPRGYFINRHDILHDSVSYDSDGKTCDEKTSRACPVLQRNVSKLNAEARKHASDESPYKGERSKSKPEKTKKTSKKKTSKKKKKKKKKKTTSD